MIEAYCEGQGSLKLRPQSHVRGNYVSKLYFSAGDGELKSVLARDLLRVGQAAFLADRAFRRGERLGQQTRRLSVCLPVEEPERWASIGDYVTNLAEFVSQDQWHFEFKQLRRRRSKGGPREEMIPNPSINLFSEGLDSLCGAAAAFLRGETPVFVTHSPPGRNNVKRKIEALQASLGFQQAKPHFMNVYFRTSDRDALGRRNMFPEATRRTRPMLFLSMAGAAALELRVPKIHLNENGVLAINLPILANLHGTRITRHAHPETLRRFEALLQALWPFDSQPTVDNPLFHLTKAEEIRYLKKATQLAEETVTCEHARRPVSTLKSWLKRNHKQYANVKECGLCVPCLVRRSAMQIAGITESAGHYVFDARRVFNKPGAYRSAPLYGQVSGYVSDLHGFADRIAKIKPCEFGLSYMYELSLLPGPTENVEESVRTTFELYRRFARQFIKYIRN